MQASDTQTIDMDIVEELKDVMGDDFSLLVESFIRDGQQRLQVMKVALDGQDQEALRAQAHSFKGSSSNLGALQVRDYCLALETLASRGELAAAPAEMEKLESAFLKASEALKSV